VSERNKSLVFHVESDLSVLPMLSCTAVIGSIFVGTFAWLDVIDASMTVLASSFREAYYRMSLDVAQRCLALVSQERGSLIDLGPVPWIRSKIRWSRLNLVRRIGWLSPVVHLGHE
jgi:hypothetical protein